MQLKKKVVVLKSYEDAVDIQSELEGRYAHHLEGSLVVQGHHPTHGEIVLHLSLIGECFMVTG